MRISLHPNSKDKWNTLNFIEAAIFLLCLAIVFFPIASRFHVPFEIILVIGACVISLVPGMPVYHINPTIVFNLFLPPILFAGAYFTSWHEFKFNFRPISLLAIGLVIFTATAVAVIIKLLIPELSWGEGFLLGAIVSPTDASSAVAIIKKLGAPRRLIVILEGESLVNDATALLLFRFSLVAIMVGSFSLTSAVTNFIMILIGGAVIGIMMGIIGIFLLKRIHDSRAETTFTFIIAFLSYFIAEHLGVSGVISTVVAGIYFGIRFPETVTSETRVSAKASWFTLIFIVNGFVFTLIGLQLPSLLKNLESYSMPHLFLYGTVVTLVVIAARLIWVYPAAYFPRVLVPAIARRDPMPPWQMLFALGWSGMRGIISLAAALSIPLQMNSGLPFPHRNILIFITYCVVLLTLIIPTVSLPCLISMLHLTEDPQSKIKEEALARMKSLEGVVQRVKEIAEKERIPCAILAETLNQIQRRMDVIKTQLEETPYSSLNQEYFSLKKLMIAALESERDTLIHLRKTGEIYDEVFHKLLDELDLEEMRSKSLRL